MTIDKLLALVEEYNPKELERIKRAYEYANEMHRGQLRDSGEPYIIHPLSVAYMIAEAHLDADTVCAGLLHDTLEDTTATKEEIAELFGKDVANLVDGVTKLSMINFSTKEEQKLANFRKLMISFTTDVRCIFIKIFDNLHNMRTLVHKKDPLKRRENALNSMQIYAPTAYFIGAYRIKNELEDLAFRHIEPDMYNMIEERKRKIEQDSKPFIDAMVAKIKRTLDNENILYKISVRTKNIYGIYKCLKKGNRMSDIHDLFAIKIIVDDDVNNCYQTLGLIHNTCGYHPVNYRFKDHISIPKPNLYQSLHTTVFGPNNMLVQIQIRTSDMDKVAINGLLSYWDITGDKVGKITQSDLKNKFQFFTSLSEINKIAADNQGFADQTKREVFADKVYVYTTKGEIIELPKGATPIDFAYRTDPDSVNIMVSAYVNGVPVPPNCELKNKDIVKIVTDEISFGPRWDLMDSAKTSAAKQKIRGFIERK